MSDKRGSSSSDSKPLTDFKIQEATYAKAGTQKELSSVLSSGQRAQEARTASNSTAGTDPYASAISSGSTAQTRRGAGSSSTNTKSSSK